jgi:type I restriction enzyme M protein
MEGMRFQTSQEKHELSELYEGKIQNMGNSGRNGGEYYTPRPLIRAIIKVVQPKLGDKIYDGACGSAGFLVEAFNYLKESKELTVADFETLQKKTLFGKEFKPLPYIIAIMNMILHGVEAPNIIRKDTLSENIMAVQTKDQFNVVLANPPFGAATSKSDIQNFPIKTGETAYMFIQHFIKYLKAGGNAGVVIKNTFLSNSDATEVRRELLESCNLYAVLDLPAKVFSAGVKTVVLFFKKGEPTKKIWYYQLNLDRNLGKTNPLNENDLADFLACYQGLKETENSWFVDLKDVDQNTLDLSVKNPNKSNEVIYREPAEIVAEIEKLDTKSAEILGKIKELM